MPKDIFSRLGGYYRNVSKVLAGEADAADVFPNSADRGGAREEIYETFLRQHAPSKCNVFSGGFLFQEDGSESGQLDVIVTTDTTPQFNFPSSRKSFSPVEGTLAVAAIKSTFEKRNIYETLSNIASIPPMKSLKKRVNPSLKVPNYDDWPLKIVFAHKGKISSKSIYRHILQYYEQHPDIPLERRPNIIHVAGTCAIIRMTEGYETFDRFTGRKVATQLGDFDLITTDSDLQAVLIVLDKIQKCAAASKEALINHRFQPETDRGRV